MPIYVINGGYTFRLPDGTLLQGGQSIELDEATAAKHSEKLTPSVTDPNRVIGGLVQTAGGDIRGPNGIVVSKDDLDTALRGSVYAEGLVVFVAAFQVGQFNFEGGFIQAIEGTWYVGVEMWSRQVRLLPRLGHRGWIPVAKIVASATQISSIETLTPEMPPTRIPRTLRKVIAGETVRVVIMGSSLTASGGSATDWPGMVFGGGDVNKYKLPTTTITSYTGVGGSPNKYQLAQTGLWGAHTGYGFSGSGYPATLEVGREPPLGRSAMLANTDLVVIGMLANGGDYATSIWEPLIRNLRKQGCEVIVVTDNPQGPTNSFSTMLTSGLYSYGPELIRLADLYGVELADTAAYVFEAHLRAGAGIYGDTIHMSSGTPTGPDAVTPANGHEAWARAVRSILSVGMNSTPKVPVTTQYDFASGLQGWANWSVSQYSDVANVTGQMVISKGSTVGQWGAVLQLPSALPTGSTVRVQGQATLPGGGVQPAIGLVDYVWVSNIVNVTASGAFDVTVTATGQAPKLLILVNPESAAQGTSVVFDNLTVTITVGPSVVVVDRAPGRASGTKPLPPSRICTDIKTPGDAYVIPAKYETNILRNHGDKGTLGPHPWGTSSLARRHSPAIGANEDLLTLAPTKRAVFAAECAYGYGLICYRAVADGASQIQVYANSQLMKTINLAVAPFDNDWFIDIFTPTELAATGIHNSVNFEILVVSGTLKVVAGVALTAECEFIRRDEIAYEGTWIGNETSVSGIPVRSTDTAGALAIVKNPGRRLYWVLSSNTNSKPVDYWTDREKVSGVDTSGAFHTKVVGGLVAPDARAVIACKTGVAGSAGNRALAVGGAIVVHDR